MRAVRYLAIHGGRESRAALAEIYVSSSGIDMKKRIFSAFMLGGGKDRLVTAANSEQNPGERARAQLPKDEGIALLIKVAKTNQNPAVRKQAMFWLGQSRDPRTLDFFAEVLSK